MEKKATFGAGCFWGVEAAFRRLDGVTATRVGYAGGGVENPTYEQVCTDRTGHAEVVEVTYDDERILYEQLLAVFWAEHDPTQLNRQGPDIGSQYRSVIFTHGPEQARIAAERLEAARASGRYTKPVVTRIEPAPAFWRAEDHHQRYFQKHGGSCHVSFAELQAQEAR